MKPENLSEIKLRDRESGLGAGEKEIAYGTGKKMGRNSIFDEQSISCQALCWETLEVIIFLTSFYRQNTEVQEVK